MLQALDGTPETSVPAEIRITGDHEFYDFEAKYLPEEATAARHPGRAARRGRPSEMRALSARAFEAVGCEGLARVDFFVMPDGSLVRQRDQHDAGLHAARRCTRRCGRPPGVDYPALVDRLIPLALARDTGLR